MGCSGDSTDGTLILFDIFDLTIISYRLYIYKSCKGHAVYFDLLLAGYEILERFRAGDLGEIKLLLAKPDSWNELFLTFWSVQVLHRPNTSPCTLFGKRV